MILHGGGDDNNGIDEEGVSDTEEEQQQPIIAVTDEIMARITRVIKFITLLLVSFFLVATPLVLLLFALFAASVAVVEVVEVDEVLLINTHTACSVEFINAKCQGTNTVIQDAPGASADPAAATAPGNEYIVSNCSK
jgi:hypothetical protein